MKNLNYQQQPVPMNPDHRLPNLVSGVFKNLVLQFFLGYTWR